MWGTPKWKGLKVKCNMSMDCLYLFAWPHAFVYTFLTHLHFLFICLHIFVLCCHNVEHISHLISLPQPPWLPLLEQGPNDKRCCLGPGNYLLLTFTVSTKTNWHARTLTTRNNHHHYHHPSCCCHEPPLLMGYLQGVWWRGNNDMANTDAKHPTSSLASHCLQGGSWGVSLQQQWPAHHPPPILQGTQMTTTTVRGTAMMTMTNDDDNQWQQWLTMTTTNNDNDKWGALFGNNHMAPWLGPQEKVWKIVELDNLGALLPALFLLYNCYLDY